MHPSLKPLGYATVLLALAACGKHDADDTAAQTPPPAATVAQPAEPDAMAAPVPATVAAPKLQAALRELWHGHIVHTREYAIAVHDHKDADQKKAADAVVTNAKQISDAVAGFYGKPGGDRMLELLGAHWAGVQSLTDARGKADAAAAAKAMSDLTINAGDIAKFLSGANPNLPNDTVRGMLLAHIAHHDQQAKQIMAGDTQGEAATWTAMQQHMDTLADALAGAIAKQFPDKAS